MASNQNIRPRSQAAQHSTPHVYCRSGTETKHAHTSLTARFMWKCFISAAERQLIHGADVLAPEPETKWSRRIPSLAQPTHIQSTSVKPVPRTHTPQIWQGADHPTIQRESSRRSAPNPKTASGLRQTKRSHKLSLSLTFGCRCLILLGDLEIHLCKVSKMVAVQSRNPREFEFNSDIKRGRHLINKALRSGQSLITGICSSLEQSSVEAPAATFNNHCYDVDSQRLASFHVSQYMSPGQLRKHAMLQHAIQKTHKQELHALAGPESYRLPKAEDSDVGLSARSLSCRLYMP